MIIYFSTIICINIILYVFYEKFSKLINIYDKPDTIRKFHKFPVPVTGGIIIYINYIIYVFFIFSFDGLTLNFKNLFLLFLTPSFFFLFGVFDDKHTIKPKKKLFFFSIFILAVLLTEDSLIVSQLNFYTLNKIINLNFIFSLLFTTLCILLFVNALNMFDGVNVQASFYCLALFIFFAYGDFNYILSLTIAVSLIFFIILNFKNKSFLGDSGVYLLGYLICFEIISNYNLKNIIKVEEIFILMSIPGIDMFRLFIVRLIQRRSPFEPDRNHIHHIILNKYKFNNKYYLFMLPTIFIFFTYFLYIQTKNIYFIFLLIIIYFFVIFLKKIYKK